MPELVSIFNGYRLTQPQLAALDPLHEQSEVRIGILMVEDGKILWRMSQATRRPTVFEEVPDDWLSASEDSN